MWLCALKHQILKFSILKVKSMCHVLFSSGKQTHGRYLRNAGRMGWAFTWHGYLTHQLLPVPTTLITYIRLAVPTPNVLVANVFGNCITDILCHKIGTSLLFSASLFLHLSPLPRPTSFKIRKMVPHVRECCVLCLYYMWLYA